VQDVTTSGAGVPVVPTPRSEQLSAARAQRLDDRRVLDRWTGDPPGPDAPGHADPADRAVTGAPDRLAAGWRRRCTALLVGLDLIACMLASAGGSRALTDGGTVEAFLPLLVVVAIALGGGYGHRFLGHGVDEFQRVATAGVTTVAGLSTAAYALELQAARGVVLLGVPLAVLGCLLVHWAGRLALRALSRRGRCQQRAVVIGLERSVAELARTLARDPGAGLSIVAACVASSRSDRIEGVPVLGTPRDALAAMRVSRADTVVLTAWSDVSSEELRRLSWDLEGTGAELLVAPRLGEVAVPRLHLRTVGGLPLVTVREPEFTGVRRLAKTALDYLLTSVGLVLAAPLLVAVAIGVKVTSPGPVLFRQERIGRHGRPFVMHKFRSMHVDAEHRLPQLAVRNETDGPMFKIREDPRVTGFGRFIRRFSLDELPQLFDVLLGRMSLVGPRPPLPQEVEGYADDVRRRLLVTPGITGLWQVSGRSNLSWEETVRLDLSYVENWSLLADLRIIGRTVVAVLARDGAW